MSQSILNSNSNIRLVDIHRDFSQGYNNQEIYIPLLGQETIPINDVTAEYIQSSINNVEKSYHVSCDIFEHYRLTTEQSL